MQLSMRLEGTRGKGIQRFRLLNRLRERDRIGVLGSETGPVLLSLVHFRRGGYCGKGIR